jgi:pyruvate,water dikinase
MADLIRKAALPPALAEAVRAANGRLPDSARSVTAVRSSAVGEDAADCSFAGMNASFTNVRDPDEALQRVVDCWASLVGPRVVAYRAARGLTAYRAARGLTAEPAIAVVVQVTVAADRAGVAFTADRAPATAMSSSSRPPSDRARSSVSGPVKPDNYEVVADGVRLRGLRVGHQSHRMATSAGPTGPIWSSSSTGAAPQRAC